MQARQALAAGRADHRRPDFSLLGSALGLSRDPTALTTSEGSVLIVNAAYRDRFGDNRSAAVARVGR